MKIVKRILYFIYRKVFFRKLCKNRAELAQEIQEKKAERFDFTPSEKRPSFNKDNLQLMEEFKNVSVEAIMENLDLAMQGDIEGLMKAIQNRTLPAKGQKVIEDIMFN